MSYLCGLSRKDKTMKNYVTLYVPSYYANIRIEASQAMTHIAGGVTITQAQGICEASPDAPLVYDHIYLLKSFVVSSSLPVLISEVKRYAHRLLDAGEQSVAVEINGDLSFVERQETEGLKIT